MAKYIMALDAGTTSNRCILFDEQGKCAASLRRNSPSISPSPAGWSTTPTRSGPPSWGWPVEAMAKIGATAADIAAIGITNQRETTIVWDREHRRAGVPRHRLAVPPDQPRTATS